MAHLKWQQQLVSFASDGFDARCPVAEEHDFLSQTAHQLFNANFVDGFGQVDFPKQFGDAVIFQQLTAQNQFFEEIAFREC